MSQYRVHRCTNGNSISLFIYLVVEREMFYDFFYHFIIFENSFYHNESKVRKIDFSWNGIMLQFCGGASFLGFIIRSFVLVTTHVDWTKNERSLAIIYRRWMGGKSFNCYNSSKTSDQESVQKTSQSLQNWVFRVSEKNVIFQFWKGQQFYREWYIWCLFCCSEHSHKKWKVSLKGSLDRALPAGELEFPKILVPRLSQHTSNGNIQCAGKSEWSKQLYSLYVTSLLEHWYTLIFLFWY